MRRRGQIWRLVLAADNLEYGSGCLEGEVQRRLAFLKMRARGARLATGIPYGVTAGPAQSFFFALPVLPVPQRFGTFRSIFGMLVRHVVGEGMATFEERRYQRRQVPQRLTVIFTAG